MTAPIYILRGELVGLALPDKDLVPIWTRWMNDLRVTSNLLAMTAGPMTREMEENFYAAHTNKPNDALFAIYELASDAPIGSTGLHEIDHRNNKATFGIMIGEPRFWNRGYGTEATRLTLDYAFNVLGLYNVMLTVYGYNARAIRAYEKAGFKLVGRRRSARRVGQRRHDEIYMDVLASEFTSSAVASIFGEGIL